LKKQKAKTMKSKDTKAGEGVKNNEVITTNWFRITWLVALFLGAGLLIYSAFAGAPTPAIIITPLTSNQFSIVVTNSLSTTNYELYWSPILSDNDNYPFTLYAVGTLGQSNFLFNGDESLSGFFQVGLEQTYGGIPDYELADPNNPSLGILTISIDSPTNGANLN
jgi:hypothetical protein